MARTASQELVTRRISITALVSKEVKRDVNLKKSFHVCVTSTFAQIDIIGDVAIVWRVRGKTIRSVLCNIVCNSCAQCDAHTYEQTNSSLDWVLSHWAHFTVLDSFLYCVLLCVVCTHRFVTR